MKKVFNFMFVAILIIVSGYNTYVSQKEKEIPALVKANIEALAHEEGPTMLGCRPYDDATCYVFDGNGQLVDKRKNQYPGK